MNPKSEEKLLREVSKILDDPDRAEKKFKRYTQIAMIVCFLLIFYCMSSNIDPVESEFYFALCVFVSGAAFGLSLWFFQASTQTAIFVEHMSRDSVDERLEEIARENSGRQP